MIIKPKLKPAAIPRAGYEYQDLIGVEVLIRQYRDPELFAWVMVEAIDPMFKSLDDVVAARKDGSFELLQVKFTVDPQRYRLDWDWLLAKSEKGTSLLAKWAEALARVSKMGPIHSAGLKTNRAPSEEFGKCLNGTRIDLSVVPNEVHALIEVECGGAEEAKAFFSSFDFFEATPDLDKLEDALRDQLVPTDTDALGWLMLRENVRRWATSRNRPEPDGRILREHVAQLITKRRPQPIRQDFVVPEGYLPPSDAFDRLIRDRIAGDHSSITILWGTPGRGKSTYLSFLTQLLQKEGAAVVRHHYFLTAEDSTSNRTSFVEISTSLIAQLIVRHPDAMFGAPENVDQLRSTIAFASANLSKNKRRLYIVIDGLDHVWRETQRVDQLNHLFNEILPLPQNISLIIGTQRVPDRQLPGKLLTTAKEDDWIEIPRMDEVAVHRWVVQQNDARPLILRFNPAPDQRLEMIDEIAKAFFEVSQGHPLHLIYAYESLIRAGDAISAEEVRLLPPCPDGDIRTYYQGLWVRLGTEAKSALHMLAGSDFFWPSLGIRQVLGEFSEIDYLLDPRNVGMVPFHSSVFAWVRDQADHEEVYQALLPQIVNWLAKDAPDYWRWGWLWLAQAKGGDYECLLAGTTRDWVVESLSKGWPDQQIENILAAAETRTFEEGDLPRTLTLRSLKARVSNAREFQSRDFAAYRATALAISHNHQQTLNLLDDIYVLDDREVTELARRGPDELTAQTMSVCFNELARRVNAWISLRHRPEHEFTALSDQLLSISAMMDEASIRRTLLYARGFRNPEPHVSRLIDLLGNAENIKGLQSVRKTLGGRKWHAQRRMIDDALLRAGSFAGAQVSALVQPGADELSPFAACWFLWRDRNVRYAVHIAPIPADILRKQYSLTENEDVTIFFYESFWIALLTGLIADGNDYNIVYPGLGGGDPSWILSGFNTIEKTAKDIVLGHIAPTFSAVYSAAADIDPLEWGYTPEREHAQYRSFKGALLRIAVDLHLLGINDPTNTKIPTSELTISRRSAHWSDEVWITRNLEHRVRLLEKDGAADILGSVAKVLSENVTEFSERGERWAELADLARLYEDGRQDEFLRHAAECLVGYGYRKDLGASNVLDSIVELAAEDPIVSRARLDRVAPIIDMITEFTDGDETNHIRSEFISVVASVAPDRLPSLYEHHLASDAYYYADACLIELARLVDFESVEGAALARTFLDERTLSILEDRARNDPAACTLLEAQNAFLGRPAKRHETAKPTEEELSDREGEATKIDPKSFGPDEFFALVHASAPLHYEDRGTFMVSWLYYWKDQGEGGQALSSVLNLFETGEASFGADEILDDAFRVSLMIEGKDAAYPWLVRAHIHRHGWSSNWTSEAETTTRLKMAARYYPDRWWQYIMDTSAQAPYFRRRQYTFVIGYEYLVKFLMLVGQTEIADRITASFVETLVEEVREQPIPEAPWFR